MTFQHIKNEVVELADQNAPYIRAVSENIFYGEFEIIKKDIFLQAQVDQRSQFYNYMSKLIIKSENEGLTTEEQNALFLELKAFLETDPNHIRILLYIPFSLFPDEGLRTQEFFNFRVSFQEAWVKLLYEIEPRANYLDGDILEDGMGELELVAKAGHLIPFFIQKGLLDKNIVLLALESTGDEVVKKSITEGLNFYNAINSQMQITKEMNITSIDIYFRSFESKDIVVPNDISDKRKKWLYESETERRIAIAAYDISSNINRSLLKVEDIESFLLTDNLSEFRIRSIIESLGFINIVPKNFEEILSSFSQTSSTGVRKSVIRTLSRLVSSKLIDNTLYKNILGKDPLDSEALNQSRVDFSDIIKLQQTIENDSYLSANLFNVVGLAGSRSKGYSEIDSDTDIVLFFRPTADQSQQKEIIRYIKTFHSDSPIDNFLEFWFDKLESPTIFKTKTHIKEMNAAHIHFLIGGLHFGNDKEFNGFYKKLLVKYFTIENNNSNGRLMRSQLLRQLELDTLQYRLMHRGYRQKYRSEIRKNYHDADLIDWTSDFYDEGYRKVATLLFLKKVFLPIASKSLY